MRGSQSDTNLPRCRVLDIVILIDPPTGGCEIQILVWEADVASRMSLQAMKRCAWRYGSTRSMVRVIE